MKTNSITYFAYGSNLHPMRLTRRIPNTKLICTASIRGYLLAFNKRGQDNSSKCNIIFTGNPRHLVYGAVYQMENHSLQTLDKIEGLNAGYEHHTLVLNVPKGPLSAITYVAMSEYLDGQDKPFSWYKEMVISGMEFLGFSQAYIDPVRSLEGKADWNSSREKQMRSLLAEMKNMPNNISEIYGIAKP